MSYTLNPHFVLHIFDGNPPVVEAMARLILHIKQRDYPFDTSTPYEDLTDGQRFGCHLRAEEYLRILVQAATLQKESK